MHLLLGIDLGTSYFKVGLFTATGELKGLGRVPVETVNPTPGRHELSVEDFWRRLRLGLDEALAQACGGADCIVGVSYSSQANSFLLLDANDAPLTPIILWTDARAEPVDEALAAFAGTEAFGRTTGFRGLTGLWMVAKLRWFAKNESAMWKRVRRVMTISDYLTFALTGEYTGDAGTAALLGILDLERLRWWPEALDACGVDQSQLSVPMRPGSPCGRTVPRGSSLIGAPAGIPFAVGSLDHHVAAVGSGLGWLGNTSISTGTVLAALTLVDDPAPKTGCYHGPHIDGMSYYRLMFDPNGAGQLEDYRRRFAASCTIEQLIALAERGSTQGEVQRETGPTHSGINQGDAVRRILERIAFTHRRLVGEISQGGEVKEILATGGGSRSTRWLEIEADFLGVPVLASACEEPACLGAAMFGGIAAGVFHHIEEASQSMVHPGQVALPGCRG